MANPNEDPNTQAPPAWAVDQVSAEQDDMDDPGAVTKRAWELVREVEEQEAERHDEYDDPDQGGEA